MEGDDSLPIFLLRQTLRLVPLTTHLQFPQNHSTFGVNAFLFDDLSKHQNTFIIIARKCKRFTSIVNARMQAFHFIFCEGVYSMRKAWIPAQEQYKMIMQLNIGVRPPYDFLKEKGSEIKES